MRRAVARGRVFPQKFSIDRRIGRLSLKAVALFPLMWVNADDQGRLSGDPEEIKYAVCPNIDHITKQDIPDLLKELMDNKLILHYNTSGTYAIQILDWWDHPTLQWAWPSEYPAPNGWEDHLRYKQGAATVITRNWFSPERSPEKSPDRSGETTPIPPLGTPSIGKGKGKGKGKGRGKRNSPEFSGEPSPSLLVDPPLFQNLVDAFSKAWGRMPDSRETAQLRDLGIEISSAGGATSAEIYDAFKEAACQNKLHISYVRAILLDWMGVERVRAP